MNQKTTASASAPASPASGRSMGEAAHSDIDVLVTLRSVGQRPPVGLKWFGLEEELTRVLGRKVDLISEKALSPYIRPFLFDVDHLCRAVV